MTIEERLEKLEKESARGRRFSRWLAAGLVLWVGACAIVWTLNWEKPGRYVLSAGRGGVFVLDTKTSKLWDRAPLAVQYLGTNDDPQWELTAESMDWSISQRVKEERDRARKVSEEKALRVRLREAGFSDAEIDDHLRQSQTQPSVD